MADARETAGDGPASLAPGHTYGSVTDKISSIVLIRPVQLAAGSLGFARRFALIDDAAGRGHLPARRGGRDLGRSTRPVMWGFAIVNFVWWIGIGHAGTLISAILLLLKQEWRTSINRFAEAMTLFAVACAGLFPLLHLGRPWFFYWLMPYPNTMALWPQWRSPLVWDVFAVSTYATVSLLFWYVGLIPDLATLRDRATNRFGADHLRHPGDGLARLGAATGTATGRPTCCWRPGDAAGRLGAHGRQLRLHGRDRARLALDDLPALLRRRGDLLGVRDGADAGHPAPRRFYGLEDFITMRHLDNMAKVMLATGLIVAYGYVMEAFIAWYSGNTYEQFMMHEPDVRAVLRTRTGC